MREFEKRILCRERLDFSPALPPAAFIFFNVVLSSRRPPRLPRGQGRDEPAAARLIEEMERAGLVSAMQSNGNREVLVPAGD